MFQPFETVKPDPDLEARLRESFGRLRDRQIDEFDLRNPERDPDDEVREPSLPAKLFIGPNATWYDDRWRWMDWRGRRRSWNWAAASTFGTWFGYRRMYGWLLAQALCVLSAVGLILIGLPLLIPLAVLVVASALAGLYGNHLYLRHFRRHAGRIAELHDDHEDQIRAVARAGGVDRRMAWLGPALLVVAAGSLGMIVGLAGLGPTINL